MCDEDSHPITFSADQIREEAADQGKRAVQAGWSIPTREVLKLLQSGQALQVKLTEPKEQPGRIDVHYAGAVIAKIEGSEGEEYSGRVGGEAIESKNPVPAMLATEDGSSVLLVIMLPASQLALAGGPVTTNDLR